MLLQILTKEDVDKCLKLCPDMEDGNKTQPLKGVKKNTESIKIEDEVRNLVASRIVNNPFVDSVICPNRVSVNFYNNYTKGDYYNKHIDNFKAEPKINHVYFDYGFTVCLSDNYEGGEFVLDNEIGEVPYKLKAGQVLFFPIIYPHSVNKVTEGSRKALIGWLSTNVSYEQSFVLRNLYEVNAHAINNKQHNLAVKSTLVQNYLKKQWGR